LEKEKTYQVEKKAVVDFIKKIIKEVNGVHSIKGNLFGKNIRIKQTPEGADIRLGIIVKREASVPAVVKEVQDKLKQEMEKTLGTVVKKIDVAVKGIKFSS